MIDDEFKQRVREATDLVALVQGDGVDLKRAGDAEWKAKCPFHEESSASFTVNTRKQFYHCFGCNEHGDAFAWVMKRRNLDFPAALKELAGRAGLALPEQRLYRPTLPPAFTPAPRPRAKLDSEKFRPLQENSAVWRYLTETRRIPASVLGRYRLCESQSKEAFYQGQGREDWASVGFGYTLPEECGKERPRLEVVKLLNLERDLRIDEQGREKRVKVEWRAPEGRRSVLYGMEAIAATERELVICEGEMDALSWAAWGFSAVSVPSGAGSLGWVEPCYDWLERFDKIHLSFDEDRAGRAKVVELLQRIGSARCGIVRLPEKPSAPGAAPVRFKDANECLQAGLEAEAMRRAVEQAEVVRPDRLKAPDDFESEIWEKFHPSGRDQLGYVLPWGNRHGSSLPFRFRLGEVTVWSGHNGHGKSQVLNHVIVDLAWQGMKSLLCSFEMNAPETYRRLIRMVRAEARPADCPREEFRERCLAPLRDKVWVYDHVGMAELDEVLGVALYARRRYDVRFIVIDSLMCLKVAGSEEKYDEQRSFMNRLCSFAAENGVHVVLVAHAKKMDTKGNKEHAIPRKYDIAGSADISNLAFNVCIVWRNKKKEERLKELWEQCARRAGKVSSALTPADFARHYTPDETEEVGTLLADMDAYFLVDKQRGGEGDEPVRHLWFHRGTLQYLEQPVHGGGTPRAYWQETPRYEAIALPEPADTPSHAMSTGTEDEL